MTLQRQFRFSWPASIDPDGDPVQYEGEYRVNAGAWTSLFALQSARTFAWDTIDLAAGLYEVRVRAHDGFTYSGWVVSAVFAVHFYDLVAFRLRIRNADDDGDELVISSLPGDARLCISGIPHGDGQEFNPLTGEATVGAWLVEAVDRFLDDDVTWAVTEKVFDAEARQQLLSRKAFLEITRDTGDTWQGLVTGFVNRFELIGGLKWTFSIGEARRQDREKRLFEEVTAAFGNITTLIGSPSRSWWGPLYNYPAYWVFEVVEVATGYVTLQMVDGWALDDADFGGRMGRHLTIAGIYARERANELSLPELVRTDGVALSGRYPGIDVELTGPGGGTFTPTAQLGSDGLSQLIGDRGEMVLEWAASQPLVGDQFAVQAWRKKITPDNPLHYRGHPIDLLTAGWAELGLAYDAAAAAVVRAELGPDIAVLLRLTHSYSPEEMEQMLGGLLGFAVRRNTDGERQLFRSRVRNITTPATEVTLQELRAVETPVFRAEEALLCNSLVIRQKRFIRWSTNQPDSRPADDVLEIPLEFGPFDNGETDQYGEHQQVYELPGIVIASASGIEYGSGFFEDGLAQELFDRFGRGGQVAELEVTLDVAEVLGEEILLTLPHLPVGGGRGGSRCMQIVKRTPVVGGAELRVLDTGEDAQPATNPTFTLAQSAVDVRKYAELTITNAATLNAAGIRVRVEWGFGAVEPDGGALLTEYAEGEIPTGAITLPPLDAGTHVWVRLQSFQHAKRAGPYTAWDDVDLDDLQPPSDIVFTPGATGDDIVDVSFVAVETDMPHELYKRLQGAPGSDAVLIAVLPPGAYSYAGIPVDVSTGYTFGVRAVEQPPWQGVSTTREEDYTAGATPSDLDPPTLDDLSLVENWVNVYKNFDSVGGTRPLAGFSSWRIHPTASASGFALGAPIEIWISQETAPGSGIFTPYALHYPTTDTVPPGGYPYPPTDPTVGRSISGWTVTPYDASLIRVKCRHAIDGGAVSAFSAEQEFTRELYLPGPPDFVAGLDPSATGPGVPYQAAPGSAFSSEAQVSPVRGGLGVDASATGPGLAYQSTLGANFSVGYTPPAGTYDWTADTVHRPSSDNNPGNTLGDATHRWYDIQAMTAVLATSIGVGLAAPTGVRVYASDGNAMAAALTTTDRIIISEQGAAAGMSIVVASATAGHRAVYKGVRAGGTLGTPLVPNTNDDVLTFLGAIYDGTDTEATAGIFFKVDGAVSNNVAPQRISFVTSATDAASRVERVTIGSTGLLTAIYGAAITSGRTLSWTSDNAAGSLIGATATTGRPYGAYIGTELVVGTDPGSAIITGLTTNFKSRLQGGMLTEGGAAFGVAVVTYGATPNFFGFRFNGTKGAETGIVSGNILLNLVGVGYDTTGPNGGTGSQFRAQSTETWSATAHGAGLAFVTVSNTTTTATVRWTMDHDGMLYPGNFGTAADNVYDAGRSGSRMRTVYAYTGNFAGGAVIIDGATAKITLDGADGVIAAGSTGIFETGGGLSMSTRGTMRFFIDNDASGSDFYSWYANVNAPGTTIMSLDETGLLTTVGGLSTTTGTFTGLIQATLTTQQLSLRYDASNHLAVTVASNGAVTLDATGAGAAFTFSDAVTVSAGLTATTGTFSGDVTTSSDNLTVGFGITTENQNGILTVISGTHGGANDKDGVLLFNRGATEMWRVGLIGQVATDGALRIRDSANGLQKVVINATGAGDIDFTGAVDSDLGFKKSGTQVVSARVTGYTAFTGSATNRATAYDTATITLPQLAERVRALQIDLTAHGLVGA